MFQRLIVPVDGSRASWSAVPVAVRYAEQVAGEVEVVTVVDRLTDVSSARDALEAGVARLEDPPVPVSVQVLAGDVAARAIADHLESSDGSMVLMSGHGHGRSAAVVGSTTDGLLRRAFGPVIVVGPNVDGDTCRLGGRYVTPVDGSHSSESILPIAEAWAIEFGAVPWIVEVVHADVRVPDMMESAYPARLAHDLAEQSGHQVEYDVLHGERPSRAIVDFATANDASLIFATTHGRTGLSRLRLGSVASEIVRHAHCPVVLSRPPHLPD